MHLSDLQNNESGIIYKVRGRDSFRRRMGEMGFVRGKKITVLRNAPLKDPIEYSIMSYDVSLRRSEAQLIEVITEEEARKLTPHKFNGTLSEEALLETAIARSKEISIALVGNPNCGKTTLFNHASHSKEHVGNYGGVTIESKSAAFSFEGYTLHLMDLPGTYSLSAYTPEELFVRKYLLGEMPDIVINVLDASNLERNLFLTTQLIDMDMRVVIALNMFDELIQRNDRFDYKVLGDMIGIPIIPTVSTRGKGLYQLFSKVIDIYEDRNPSRRQIYINYGTEIENSVQAIQEVIRENKKLTDKISGRFYAIKMLEKDKAAQFSLSRWENYKKIKATADAEIKRLTDLYHEETESLITDARYGFISGALKETYRKSKKNRRERTQQLDNILTHKFWGYPIFLFFMFFTFYSTFELGKYPVIWLQDMVGWLSHITTNILPPGSFRDLLTDGIIGGVGSVIIFLPNILTLFLFIAFMEDSGYMARAAFIMDKIMHKVGLHGRSFIPLLMGFGCNVPAILSTRTIPSHNNRILTMLINPLMSCSARLPVYILIISAFFPKNPGIVLFSLYITGIVLAAIIARLFKKFFFRKEEAPFVMELPPYRMPTVRSTLKHMWNNGEQYLRKIGNIILAASLIIWALSYFPRTEKKDTVSAKIISSSQMTPTSASSEKYTSPLENSYIGRIGKGIEPFFHPLGFDWKMSVSILTGIAAKEVVVSTMGVLYLSDNGTGISDNMLAERIKQDKFTKGKNAGKSVFDKITALSFIFFILLYFPCIATITAIGHESGSWKWALLAVTYTTALAWIVAFIIHTAGRLFF
ncbi:MAG: ferrous iron transport protein B [Chlorobi bacterium]|nr:ferrous iron transport protein B [Chlorobiota bacterium]